MECKNCEAKCGRNYVEHCEQFYCCGECAQFDSRRQANEQLTQGIQRYEETIVALNLMIKFTGDTKGLYSVIIKICKTSIFMMKCAIKQDKKVYDGFGKKWDEYAVDLMEKCTDAPSGEYLLICNQLQGMKKAREGVEKLF